MCSDCSIKFAWIAEAVPVFDCLWREILMDRSTQSPHEKVPTTDLQGGSVWLWKCCFSLSPGKVVGLLAATSQTFLWLSPPYFLCDRPCCAATWHRVDTALALFGQQTCQWKQDLLWDTRAGLKTQFFQELWGLWPGLSGAQAGVEAAASKAVPVEPGGGLKEACARVWVATRQVWRLVFFWFGLLREPILLPFPVALPSNLALCLPYEVEELLGLLKSQTCVISQREAA